MGQSTTASYTNKTTSQSASAVFIAGKCCASNVARYGFAMLAVK